MHRRTQLAIVSAIVLASATTAIASPALGGGDGPTGRASTVAWSGDNDDLGVIGITDDQQLVTFPAGRPERAVSRGKIRGLQGDTKLVGIDYRVQDGRLYGVGDKGGVYIINLTRVKGFKVNNLTVPLDGTAFGVDFNPAADRLRIISDTGQNLRHDVNPGGMTIVDGVLTTPPATTPSLGVTGAGYTNNDLDANTATSLFDIDTTLDQVVLQSPANSGQLAATGKLGVDVEGDAGFDVYSDLVDATTERLVAFASFEVDGSRKLYEVSLLTGDADVEGAFPGELQVTDLAIRVNQ